MTAKLTTTPFNAKQHRLAVPNTLSWLVSLFALAYLLFAREKDRVVYSTDSGRITTCPDCGQPYKNCRCGQPATSTKKSDGIVRVMRDRKQRGGKTVTVIDGLPQDKLTTLGQQLKKLCGSGGTVKEGNIEIQGDHCDKVIAKLTELGYKVKRAGG
jgi:translation initiation factor 1